jgi:hypothetical protein
VPKNRQHIETLKQRIRELDAASDSLDAGHGQKVAPQKQELGELVKQCLEVCKAELGLRQAREALPKDNEPLREASKKQIESFRRSHRTFYKGDPLAGVANPIRHCGTKSSEMQTAFLRMDLDGWLAGSSKSLEALQLAPGTDDREVARRTVQRRLLVDAMLDIATDNPTLLGDTQFRNRLLQRLKEHPFKNVTWCEATNMISELLYGRSLPSFEERLRQVQEGRNDLDFFKHDKVVRAALLMRGCFEWNKDADNDFRLWLNKDGPEPREHSTMNCWEAVYFAAYKAGVMTKDQLQGLYERNSEGNASLLGYDGALGYTPDLLPKLTSNEGDVLFCDTGDGDRTIDPYKHVVLSLGSRNGPVETMSLWTFGTGGTFDKAPLTAVFKDHGPEVVVSVKTASPFFGLVHQVEPSLDDAPKQEREPKPSNLVPTEQELDWSFGLLDGAPKQEREPKPTNPAPTEQELEDSLKDWSDMDALLYDLSHPDEPKQGREPKPSNPAPTEQELPEAKDENH